MIKKIWKRTLCFIMALSMILIPIVGEMDEVQAASQKTNEKKAYSYIKKAAKKSEKVMDSIYGAWYFDVYEAGDYDVWEQGAYAKYTDSMPILERYSEESGIPEKNVVRIYSEVYGESAKEIYGSDEVGLAAILSTLECNLDIVDHYYTENGTFKQVKSDLANAKKYIKKLPKSSKKKKLLMNYYNAVNKYYKFVYSPSGSFAQLEGKREAMEDRISDCKEALSW